MSCTTLTTVFCGDALRLTLSVVDDSENPLDLNAATAIRFSVAKEIGIAPTLINRTLGAGVTLLAQSGDTLGQAVIDVPGASTATIVPGLYWCDAEITTADGPIEVVAPTRIRFAPKVPAP